MDPLLAGLVSVFVVTAAIVALLFFLKFRHRNERPEFRRLQDLPMVGLNYMSHAVCLCYCRYPLIRKKKKERKITDVFICKMI